MSKIDKIEELQNILKDDQTNFQARRKLAVLLLDCGYPEEAKQHFLYLSKIFNDDSGIFYNLGITYEKLKDLDKAEDAYKKAIEYARPKGRLYPTSLEIFNLKRGSCPQVKFYPEDSFFFCLFRNKF